MSAAFTAVAKALNDNPELSAKVMSVVTPAERAEILKAAGVAVPTHDDVNSHYASLSDVSGAGSTGTAGPAPVAAAAGVSSDGP